MCFKGEEKEHLTSQIIFSPSETSPSARKLIGDNLQFGAENKSNCFIEVEIKHSGKR